MKNKIWKYMERVTGSMTENSRNALILLFSVILLTGTVLGVILPFQESCAALREQTRVTNREAELLRSYAADTEYADKLLQNRLKLASLRSRFAPRPEATAEMRRLYESAARHQVKVRALRQCSGGQPAPSRDRGTGNAIGHGNPAAGRITGLKRGTDRQAPPAVSELYALVWEIELSGGYYALRDFLREAGTGGRYTIFDRVSLQPEDIVSGLPADQLRLRGRVSVFYTGDV